MQLIIGYKAARHTFFSSSHEMFTKINHIQVIKIYSYIQNIINYVVRSNGIKVEINNRKIARYFPNTRD
jgi:hypothetical protein